MRWVSAFIMIALGFLPGFLYLAKPALSDELARESPASVASESESGFAQVDDEHLYRFPQDHGAHPRFPSELWHFTGYLSTDNTRPFSFQLKLFRLALAPGKPDRPSAWATYQFYGAHLALTDPLESRFYSYQRYSRAALGLAGNESHPLSVWVENWKVVIAEDASATFHIQAETADLRLELNLKASQKPLTGFAAGTARRAFLAYILPRLEMKGRLIVGETAHVVTGEGMLSRGWGRVPFLGSGQTAMNRFELQLDDGREIFIYELRRRDGTGVPVHTAMMVDTDGSLQRLARHEFSLETQAYWTSPRQDVAYPSKWQLRIPRESLELDIIPWLKDQEFKQVMRYWSGGVKLKGQLNQRPIQGKGHVELISYTPGLRVP